MNKIVEIVFKVWPDNFADYCLIYLKPAKNKFILYAIYKTIHIFIVSSQNSKFAKLLRKYNQPISRIFVMIK